MDQRKELENRNEIVTALQRNFEALSMFCKKERGENQTLKSINEKLRDENRKFIEKITGMDNKIKCLSADNELLAKDRVKAKKQGEEILDLKMQVKLLTKQVENSKSNSKRLSETNERLKNEITKIRQDYKTESEKVKALTQKLQDDKSVIDEVNKKHKLEMYEMEQKYKRMMDDLKESLAKVKGNSAKEQDNLIDELQECRAKIRELERQ